MMKILTLRQRSGRLALDLEFPVGGAHVPLHRSNYAERAGPPGYPDAVIDNPPPPLGAG